MKFLSRNNWFSLNKKKMNLTKDNFIICFDNNYHEQNQHRQIFSTKKILIYNREIKYFFLSKLLYHSFIIIIIQVLYSNRKRILYSNNNSLVDENVFIFCLTRFLLFCLSLLKITQEIVYIYVSLTPTKLLKISSGKK